MDGKRFRVEFDNDKKVGIYCLTIIAIFVSIFILLLYPDAWREWLVVLSTIVGVIGGVVSGESFKNDKIGD